MGIEKRESRRRPGPQKTLTLELSAMTRTNLGQLDLDAKSCYDRMSRQIAVQACYKHGVPILFCNWMYKLLAEQKHYIITANGVSKRHYGTTPQRQHHGIGQGSTEAPVIWLLISSVIIQTMRQTVKGMSWTSPSSDMKTTQFADIYVDDATLWTNGEHDATKLSRQMEKDINSYQEQLRWTGGALTLHKCYFSILEWGFTPEGQPYAQNNSHTIRIERALEDQKKIQEIINEVKEKRRVTPLQVHNLQELTGEKFSDGCLHA